MAKTTSQNRAPRGTRTLTHAFFSAADGIPEPQRAAVINAALAAIRDQLKASRGKAAVAKAKAKEKAGKAPTAPADRTPAGPKHLAKAVKTAAPVRAKAKSTTNDHKGRSKPARQPAQEIVPEAAPAASDQTEC